MQELCFIELLDGGNGTFVPKTFPRLNLFPVIDILISACWTIGDSFPVPKLLALYTSIS